MNSFGYFCSETEIRFVFSTKEAYLKELLKFEKKNSKALLTYHFCKKLSLGWTAHIFLHSFFPNCTRYQYLLLLFSNQKFYEQEITKCIIVQETITYLSPLHPQKTTHKHVAFTVFLYRQKVSSSPESYSPKNGVLSYFIASIDLELFTTSPKLPIFNLNIKSINKINFLPHPIFLRN
jgi:hypothetical protein